MSFQSILQAISTIKEDDQIVILEVGPARMTAVRLRPSPLWGHAVVGAPQTAAAWPEAWRQKTAQASREDLADLAVFAQAPGIDLTDDLRGCVTSLLAEPARKLLLVGQLAANKFLDQLCAECWPDAERLPPQAGLTLPADLSEIALRQAVAQFYPPWLDADYTLTSFSLNAREQKLEERREALLRKGETPPAIPQFFTQRLYRVIDQTPTAPKQPVHLIIHKSDTAEPVYCQSVTPEQNLFQLKCWFNYQDDQLRVRITDLSDKDLPTQAAPTPLPPLPALIPRHDLDIAIIVDGTLRKAVSTGFDGAGQEIKEHVPDVSEVREFVQRLLESLNQNQTTKTRCALCLYGDYPFYAKADYLIKPWEFQPTAQLLTLLSRPGTPFQATKDLDYEAALEQALFWANPQNGKLGWSKEAQGRKGLIIIGYAPPHPQKPADGQPYAYPTPSGLRHEPVTSPIHWEQQIKQIRYAGVQVQAVWLPAPDMRDDHPCMKHSHDVWHDLGGKEPHVGLSADTRQQIVNAMTSTGTAGFYVTDGAAPYPLFTQLHQLRVKTTT
jgi:hypothetical protein